MINYALVYQYMPFKRLKEFLDVCFGLSISQGTIFNTIQRTANKSKGIYEFIKNYIGENVIGDSEIIYNETNEDFEVIFSGLEDKLSTLLSKIFEEFDIQLPTVIRVSIE